MVLAEVLEHVSTFVPGIRHSAHYEKDGGKKSGDLIAYQRSETICAHSDRWFHWHHASWYGNPLQDNTLVAKVMLSEGRGICEGR